MSWNDVASDSYIVETHLHVLSEGDYEANCECAAQKHLDYIDAVSYAHERINELQMNGYKEINQYHNRPNLEWELATDKGSITTVAVVELDGTFASRWSTVRPFHEMLYSKT